MPHVRQCSQHGLGFGSLTMVLGGHCTPSGCGALHLSLPDPSLVQKRLAVHMPAVMWQHKPQQRGSLADGVCCSSCCFTLSPPETQSVMTVSAGVCVCHMDWGNHLALPCVCARAAPALLWGLHRHHHPPAAGGRHLQPSGEVQGQPGEVAGCTRARVRFLNWLNLCAHVCACVRAYIEGPGCAADTERHTSCTAKLGALG